jgi:hypothetical protein
MTLRRLRRFLLFQAFLVWQGGFVFYSAVVVPVGTEVLGSAFDQGLVTQRVTVWMNRLGLAWHLLFGWDVFADGDPNRRRAWARAGMWAASFVLLAGLAAVHLKLDDLIVDGRLTRADRPAFRTWHVVYLWLSTGQWALALANAGLTLAAWTRNEDGPRPAAGRERPPQQIPTT